MNIVLSLISLSFFNFIRKNRNSHLFLCDDLVEVEDEAGDAGEGGNPGTVERRVRLGLANGEQFLYSFRLFGVMGLQLGQALGQEVDFSLPCRAAGGHR